MDGLKPTRPSSQCHGGSVIVSGSQMGHEASDTLQTLIDRAWRIYTAKPSSFPSSIDRPNIPPPSVGIKPPTPLPIIQAASLTFTASTASPTQPDTQTTPPPTARSVTLPTPRGQWTLQSVATITHLTPYTLGVYLAQPNVTLLTPVHPLVDGLGEGLTISRETLIGYFSQAQLWQENAIHPAMLAELNTAPLDVLCTLWGHAHSDYHPIIQEKIKAALPTDQTIPAGSPAGTKDSSLWISTMMSALTDSIDSTGPSFYPYHTKTEGCIVTQLQALHTDYPDLVTAYLKREFPSSSPGLSDTIQPLQWALLGAHPQLNTFIETISPPCRPSPPRPAAAPATPAA
ncbi:hypothetical protein EBZ35_08740, partial [bacterium]|nr:hypothetical protein [bacterium]